MFRYADYIYKIYTEQSFTEAAKKLFISQPSLSATIKKTEEELGFKIFDRSVTPLALTDAGKMYIKAIEELHRVERDLRNSVEDINSLNVGTVSVGGASFISSFVLPEIIMQFTKLYPKVKINLIESNSPALQDKLLSEEIEILVDYDFDSRFYSSYPLMKEHILLALPEIYKNRLNKDEIFTADDIKEGKHLSKSIKKVDISKFKDEKFILLKSGNNMHKNSYKICKEYGFTPKALIKVDQLLTAYNIASSGMGIAFTTDTMITNAIGNENLIFCRIDSIYDERTLYIAHKKKKNISPAVTEFVRVGQKTYKR